MNRGGKSQRSSSSIITIPHVTLAAGALSSIYHSIYCIRPSLHRTISWKSKTKMEKITSSGTQINNICHSSLQECPVLFHSGRGSTDRKRSPLLLAGALHRVCVCMSVCTCVCAHSNTSISKEMLLYHYFVRAKLSRWTALCFQA